MKSKLTFLFLLLLLPFAGVNAQVRTVVDKEVGSVFEIPEGFPYSAYGAFVGSAPTGSLDPNALCVVYARFDKFSSSDTTMVRGFPYSALRQYEAQQVAAGKPPIFVTATYQGRKRPVYFAWSLKLSNGVPTAPSSKWEYAVNVQDPRFVDFWINRYVRPILWQPSASVQNVWFELDESAFNWNILGILDDSNHFVAGVPWDSPFPENGAAYLNSIASFFNQVKQVAPDLRTMPNVGSMSDPTQFQNVFASIPGALSEDIYSWHASGSTYTRNAWYQQNFLGFSWLGAQGKVGVLRANLPAGDANALRTSFVVYSLLRGPNFFFAPGTTVSTNPNPSEWESMKAALGNPTGAAQSTQKSSTGIGYRLYWRTFNNGIVYLNLSGSTQTIQLNTNYKHWDANGSVVTEISIPDLVGTYITTEPNVLGAPAISPRVNAPVTHPVLVTITSEVSGATIRYTLNGTAPGMTSPIYTGPFELSGSATVQASAFRKGENPSWPAIASYTVHPSLPTVQFNSASHIGPAGAYYPVLSLSAVPSETVTVHYSVRAPNGATTTGAVSFLPGNIYRYLPVTVSGAAGAETSVTITSVTGASLGITHTMLLTVQ
jgi:hypothetical protein